MQSKINILGVDVHPITIKELHEQITGIIRSNKHALILNVNVHAMNLAYNHPWLRNFFNQAETVFADGAGVILAARLLGYSIPERITYADWIWELASLAEKQGFTMFFLGAKPNVANAAADLLLERFPSLRIIGIHHGYFCKEIDSKENDDLVALINILSPNILILGMGMPIQERWLMENWSQLNVNIALTGGAVFDYISGELRRAPRWMTDNGLEWLGRLFIEPQRLWKRYIIGNPLFLWRVFVHHLLRIHLPG